MNPQSNRIGQTRTAFRRDHALIAPDGHVPTPLPNWDGASGVVLISPAMGAGLAQSLVLASQVGQTLSYSPSAGVEACVYVLEGELRGGEQTLRVGSFVFLPSGQTLQLEVTQAARLVVFEKRYQPKRGVYAPKRIIGHASEIEERPFLGDPDARLQVLLPETPAFDMAINIFSFQPGTTLPFVETHVMEHGLLMLEGEGIYRLNDSWYPVAAGDCIWMAPYCPQWFAATGKTPARYIYYKNINRDAMETL
jgi:(S)-ureidoglycine aminohydrolase